MNDRKLIPGTLLRSLLRGQAGLGSGVAANIVANAIIGVAFVVSVPLILPYIGVEAYGLIGFYAAIQGIVTVLDLGLNVAITRDFGVIGHEPASSVELRDLLRTSEIIYLGMAIVMALIWLGGSGVIRNWVNPSGLSEQTVYNCLLIMGVPLALQFPLSLYGGGLYGMHRQALVSAIGVVFSLLRNLGVIGILHFVSASPETYFGWNALCIGLQVPVLMIAMHAVMPATSKRPRFRSELLKRRWRFVTGIGVVTLASTLFLQVDKFVLARIVSLETFGYYSLAATVAGGLYWLSQPVFRALLPRLSRLVENSDHERLLTLYHQGTQLMAVMILPVSAICAAFPQQVVLLWQRDAHLASETASVLALLMAGGALNAMLFIPYTLQLAFSSTRVQMIMILAGLAVSVPLTVVLVNGWGPPGAAAATLILNLSFLILWVPFIHRRFIPGDGWKWTLSDVVLPLAAATVGAVVARIAYRDTDSFLLIALQLGAAFFFTTACCVITSSYARQWVTGLIGRYVAKG
ncbi:MAG TPA: oligosaccharide flippase family protein [Pyrinomonadaceae bacterium]|nr:oligosaccharide flippase family protein [Pyrinomonadaceae bacterium]